MVPVRAHNIFDNFFSNRLFNFEEDDDFFRPILHKKWSRDLDQMMIDEGNLSDIKNGEQVKTSSVYNYNNGVETKKTVTNKKKVTDGKVA